MPKRLSLDDLLTIYRAFDQKDEKPRDVVHGF